MPSAQTNIRIFKPAWRSVWFMFLGLILGPAIIVLERDPGGLQIKWWLLSLLFLGLLLHRRGLTYTLTDSEITATAWFGLGEKKVLRLKDLSRVEVHQGFSSRLADCGHLWLSAAGESRGFSILGQPAPRQLAEELEALAARAHHGQD